MIWLSEEQILMIHSDLIRTTGGLDGLRDEGLLQSALNSPLQTYDGIDLFPSIISKSARLACGLTQNHPFIDGNKRIGMHAMLVTLTLNGITLFYSQEEIVDVFLKLADGSISYQELVIWVRNHIRDEY